MIFNYSYIKQQRKGGPVSGPLVPQGFYSSPIVSIQSVFMMSLKPCTIVLNNKDLLLWLYAIVFTTIENNCIWYDTIQLYIILPLTTIMAEHCEWRTCLRSPHSNCLRRDSNPHSSSYTANALTNWPACPTVESSRLSKHEHIWHSILMIYLHVHALSDILSFK